MTIASMAEEFKALNTELLGLSVDSLYSHIAWIRRIEELAWNGIEQVHVDFPVIADLNMKVSHLYGMLQPNVSSTQAVRAVFIIDPNAVIRAIIYYPLNLGRNFDELKRIISALQKADADHCSTPANWRPGDDVILPSPVTCDEAKERAEHPGENEYSLDWFLNFRKEK